MVLLPDRYKPAAQPGGEAGGAGGEGGGVDAPDSAAARRARREAQRVARQRELAISQPIGVGDEGEAEGGEVDDQDDGMGCA